MMAGWPKFEQAVFSAWDAVPDGARETLSRAGVPKYSLGRLYWAVDQPYSVELPPCGRLIRFGNAGLHGGIYFDPSTGNVVELAEYPGAAPQLVNTSLERFTSAVKAVIDMFPYYPRNSELIERQKAGDRASAAIRQIDSAALTPDSFWETFVDDVVTGDFSTEDVVETGGAIESERPSV